MISVIMPVYNMENFLDRSIQSVLKQTYRDFEFIIVDDGSEDASWSICCRYEQSDSRVKCYRVGNRGVSEARNYGLCHASGEYIRFMDADDEMTENSLKELIYPFDMNVSVNLVIGNFKATSTKVFNEDLEGIYEFDQFIQEFSMHVPSFYYGVNWNKLYKKSILEKYNIRFNKNVHWGEDFIFNCQYYSHCEYVYFLPEMIHIYCQREQSAVNSIRTASWHDKLDIEIQRLEELLKITKYRKVDLSVTQNFYFYFLSALSNQFSWALKMKGKTLKERYEIFGMIIWNRRISELINKFQGTNVPLFYQIMIFCIKNKYPRILLGVVYCKYCLGKNSLLRKKWNHSSSSQIHFEI